jgi:hypothetical protein
MVSPTAAKWDTAKSDGAKWDGAKWDGAEWDRGGAGWEWDRHGYSAHAPCRGLISLPHQRGCALVPHAHDPPHQRDMMQRDARLLAPTAAARAGDRCRFHRRSCCCWHARGRRPLPRLSAERAAQATRRHSQARSLCVPQRVATRRSMLQRSMLTRWLGQHAAIRHAALSGMRRCRVSSVRAAVCCIAWM